MKLRVLLLGASGTIGRATAKALLAQGHEVSCLLRPQHAANASLLSALAGTHIRYGSVDSKAALLEKAFAGERFDALVSCLASRSGVPQDAWAIDHEANSHALEAAKEAGVKQMVLLSALCVQKPKLAFQHAKLAFEEELQHSGFIYSIVRPTAFFKSLSGQVARLQQGKPYLVFGDGRLTACKPIGDEDLANYIAGCLLDESRHNRILPIGGPGPATTPREQGEQLFALLGQKPRFRQVSVALLDGVVAVLALAGRFSSRLAAKAELARIGRYYATESMLVWDAQAGHYSAEATPEFGEQRLLDFQAALIRGEAKLERGEHAVF